MEIDEALARLHDSVAEELTFDFATGAARLRIRPWRARVWVTMNGVTDVRLPQEMPWGPSACIHEARLVTSVEPAQQLEIEMQSGDLLVFRASAFAVEWHEQTESD